MAGRFRADSGMSGRSDENISDVTDDPASVFVDRLQRVAVDFVLPAGLDVSGAVTLAEDMVAAGVGGSAALAVATFVRDSVLSDADQLVREMLAEHGIEVPRPRDDHEEYQILLRAFGNWNLPLRHFEGPFYGRVPAWDDQGPLDRALVAMLERRDNETNPQARAAIEQEMRDTVRRHITFW